MVVQRKYPEELRKRAVKMVLEVREREGKGHGELARIASMPWNLRPAASGLSPSVGPCRPGPVPGTLDPPFWAVSKESVKDLLAAHWCTLVLSVEMLLMHPRCRRVTALLARRCGRPL